ncbi:hypothetical protein EV426DRAFT_39627 [Tirmania nivea]|nr:hypothetical protein EV426DRAFT_39627 [Tirmania nivea]
MRFAALPTTAFVTPSKCVKLLFRRSFSLAPVSPFLDLLGLLSPMCTTTLVVSCVSSSRGGDWSSPPSSEGEDHSSSGGNDRLCAPSGGEGPDPDAEFANTRMDGEEACTCRYDVIRPGGPIEGLRSSLLHETTIYIYNNLGTHCEYPPDYLRCPFLAFCH